MDPEIAPFLRFLDPKYFGPVLGILDPETAVFLHFLDPKTAPFQQSLDFHSKTSFMVAGSKIGETNNCYPP